MSFNVATLGLGPNDWVQLRIFKHYQQSFHQEQPAQRLLEYA